MPSVYRRIYRPHKGHGRLDDDNRERCKALLAQGKTNTEIVAETGVSVAQLTRYRKNIRESGAIIPPRRKKPGPPMKPDGLRMKRKLRELEKMAAPLTRESVQAAHERIKPYIHQTPVLHCQTLDALASTTQHPDALQGTEYEGQPPCQPLVNLYFKCENFQKIGAFKIRGATHALSKCTDDQLKNGVITHSSGNHAQALAMAARMRNVPAYIIMPSISTPTKIAATASYGAQLHFSGSTAPEREALVEEVQQQTGAILIPPYDHPDIILGQGTVGLEFEQQVRDQIMLSQSMIPSAHDPAAFPGMSVAHPAPQAQMQANGASASVAAAAANAVANGHTTGPLHEHHAPTPLDPNFFAQTPNPYNPPAAPPPQHTLPTQAGPLLAPNAVNVGGLDAVIVPCGGGGHLSGIATALQGTGISVFGAEPSHSGADDCRRGLASDPPQRIESVSTLTIADGLRTPVGLIPWSVISDKSKVRGVYSVSDAQIKSAMRLLFERMKLVVEPSGAVGLAVILYDEWFRRVCEQENRRLGRRWNVGIVISGGNTTMEALGQMFREEAEATVRSGSGMGQRPNVNGTGLAKRGLREEGIVGMDGESIAENVAG